VFIETKKSGSDIMKGEYIVFCQETILL